MHKIGVDGVVFAPLLEQDAPAIEHVRNLRNSLEVRQHMYNDHQISPEEHAAWIAALRNKPGEQVWVVLHNDNIEGVVALHSISFLHKTADWAFYLSPAMQGKGVGGVVEFKLIELAFGRFGLEKLNCEVLASNPKVIEMHQKFGFELEGVRRANVIKDGQRIDVALLGLAPRQWQERRPRFARLYAASDTASEQAAIE